MKKFIYVLAVSAASYAFSSTALAQEVSSTASQTQTVQKTEIEAAQLPEKVMASLAESKKESTITKAFRLDNTDGAVVGYEVLVLTSGVEEMVKFDKEGNLVKVENTPAPEEK